MKPNNPEHPQKNNNISNNQPISPVVSTFKKKFTPKEEEWANQLFTWAMAHYLGKKKDLDKTIAGLDEVILFAPDYTDAYYNLGICYCEKGEIDKSIGLFWQVLEMDTNPHSEMHQSARFNLGNQLVSKGQYQEAVEQFEAILEINPKVIDTLYNAGFVYFKYLQEYDKAIEYFSELLKNFNFHIDAWYNLGLCYYLNENKEKALETWEKLVQINMDYVPAYYNLALVNKQLGRKDKAMFFFQKYLDIPVKDPGQYKYARHAARVLKRLMEESRKT